MSLIKKIPQEDPIDIEGDLYEIYIQIQHLL